LKNVADVPEAGDIADLMQIKCTLYVDAVTLDRRMRGYCSQVCQRLQRPILSSITLTASSPVSKR